LLACAFFRLEEFKGSMEQGEEEERGKEIEEEEVG
jgi:hypothetical protein